MIPLSTHDHANQLHADRAPIEAEAKVADQQMEAAKLRVAAIKQDLGDHEGFVAAEVLEDPSLKNEAQRKAAVAKAIREDPVATTLRQDLANAQRDLANALVAQQDCDRRMKGLLHSMQLAGHQLAREYYADFAAGCQATLRARQHK